MHMILGFTSLLNTTMVILMLTFLVLIISYLLAPCLST